MRNDRSFRRSLLYQLPDVQWERDAADHLASSAIAALTEAAVDDKSLPAFKDTPAPLADDAGGVSIKQGEVVARLPSKQHFSLQRHCNET